MANSVQIMNADSSKTERYKGCEITYWEPPIPSWRSCCYHWVHDEYDGDGDTRGGDGESVAACMVQIDEMGDA